MASNLIPLHLDKNTGGIVAKDVESGYTAGFLYTQSTPSLTWTIKHNTNTNDFILQVYNESGNQVIPNEVVVVDINTVRVNFLVAQAGKATIVLFI